MCRHELIICSCAYTHTHTHTCTYRSFMRELGVDVVPPYMIATKEAVKEKQVPVWTKKNNLPKVTDSYHQYMCNVSPVSQCQRDIAI